MDEVAEIGPARASPGPRGGQRRRGRLAAREADVGRVRLDRAGVLQRPVDAEPTDCGGVRDVAVVVEAHPRAEEALAAGMSVFPISASSPALVPSERPSASSMSAADWAP